MRKIGLISGSIMIIITFGLNIFGLMRLIPLYITTPLLFLSLLVTLSILNNRNRFKGFK
ncbi:hypothetical protein [Fredinandcohnia quinoae]|uniref:Uncharacterized protein n=1 Tax=Fredinandcohnia quinoae TaxID=2918902 RepID=A0AAW5E9Z9_9BACI|nr:hypothetical protein [Fredinandcohnia sp. SECRCQ15]MCH1626231.1 hypothetical protein [Fredinandcohnia sp. SECRCQ15]